MSLLDPSSSQVPAPLPSLPPSPTEEDISSTRWAAGDIEAHERRSNSSEARGRTAAKGKTRASITVRETSVETSGDDSDTLATRIYDEYPPISEEEEESRRVAENLKRWEELERQRRKAARESYSSAAHSVIGELTSKLWFGRKRRRESLGGLGKHQALQTEEHLTLDTSSIRGDTLSYSRMASPTFSERDATDNPFRTANPSSVSITNPNPGQRTATESTSEQSNNLPTRSSFSGPLSPTTPSPRSGMTITKDQTSYQSESGNQSSEEVRWWTDWLCGCSEGPDRGGDFQAGRTNPLE